MPDLELKADFSGVPAEFIAKTSQQLSPYFAELNNVVNQRDATRPEASLLLPDDPAALKAAHEIVQLMGGQLKYVVLIGIGGSYLGARAIYEACVSGNESRFPKLITLATADPALFDDAIATITQNVTRPEEIAICLVSKSGTTTESITNFEAFFAVAVARFGARIKNRVVIITDQGTPLWQNATNKEFKVIEHPRAVGGRYSVFSVVGMVPLALVGVDVNALLDGAKVTRDQCLANIDQSPALKLAAQLYYHRLNGARVQNIFVFNPQLEGLGKWYCQLLGESIGKLKRSDGLTVHEGILPIISVGTFDLHSMAQYYFEGPCNIFTTFVYNSRATLAASVPESPEINTVAGTAGQPLYQIMDAIYYGVVTAYKQQGLPFNEISLPGISPFYLGQIMQLKMIAVTMLANLLRVNAFNQPGVEHYKQATRLGMSTPSGDSPS